MLIISKNENEILKSVQYLLNQEKLEYQVAPKYKDDDFDKIIFITSDINDIPLSINKDLLIITSSKIDLSKYRCRSNEIITKLVDDNKKYTKAQEEYLFRDGIYSIINEVVLNFINDKTIDKMIYDTSSCNLKPHDWTFTFDSLAESYAWLSRKNHYVEKERKVIEISNDVAFNDSDKEINYLSDYIALAKKGTKITTIYVGTKADVEEKKKNRFFDILVRKSGKNVITYFCDITALEEKEPELLSKIRDGIAVYEDCVYKDTFNSEYSLGIVDCKKESIKEYTDIFNYLIKNYCVLLADRGEYVGV